MGHIFNPNRWRLRLACSYIVRSRPATVTYKSFSQKLNLINVLLRTLFVMFPSFVCCVSFSLISRNFLIAFLFPHMTQFLFISIVLVSSHQLKINLVT